jgi:hypothetical protein
MPIRETGSAFATGMAIDTHGFVTALEAAGIDRRSAEAHLGAMTAHVLPDLATKADILATRGDIDRLDTRLSTEIARLEQKIESGVQRIEAIVWKAAFAVLGGGLAIGGLLLRFLR